MKLEEKIDRLIELQGKDHEEITEIKTALVGYNGHSGLIPAFDGHCKSDRKFRTMVYVIVGILIGSGAITAWGIFMV